MQDLPAVPPPSRRVFRSLTALLCTLLFMALGSSGAHAAFTVFESGQVRPLALSSDASRLYACNTPDNRLEIFDVTASGLSHVGSVQVGLEPVAVAVRDGSTEVWVVNHLSDSVSIVDASDPALAHVTRTLHVGDEPRDIVFGGSAKDRAFITAAHRGQNIGFDPQLTTPGIGRADVWVFDAAAPGASMGGNPLNVITLFGDTPRALAVTPDGNRVYAAVFHSGNRSTVVSEGTVEDGGNGTVGDHKLPPPAVNAAGVAQPEVGIIVKFNELSNKWEDEMGRDWTDSVKFGLPDFDVFTIDPNGTPPQQLDGLVGPNKFPGVGTILFNMAVNPASGKLYVSNTEAINEVRFEGPGVFAPTTVLGHLHESRITVIDPLAATVEPRHLNKHIDYASCCDPIPNSVNERSLAFPTSMVLDATGTKLYVAAFGSSKVGTFLATEVEGDTFTPDAAAHITLSAGGPSGLALDESRSRLYVLTRFDNSISIVDTTSDTETGHVALYNPEPQSVVEGRPFLYDAALTSSHGDQACASCHVFGDFDSLAWDLGNPDDNVKFNPGPFRVPAIGIEQDFHPMKGPMTTQSLRGLDNHGPMHWRGDRTGGDNFSFNIQPNLGSFNEQAAFNAFNVAFPGLVGRDSELTSAEMQKFTAFALQISYPPNPIRHLDNSLTVEQQSARDRYFGPTSDTFSNCNGCHVLDPQGNASLGVERPGFFGTDGQSSFEGETQMFKIPHLRNMYQKVGMFGMAIGPFFNSGSNAETGDQIRGFGFIHDGSVDTIFRFFGATVFEQGPFNPGGFSNDAQGDADRRAMESFVLAYDSNLAPIVGQQVSLEAASAPEVGTRISLMLARADATPSECDVVVSGNFNPGGGSEQRNWLYDGAGMFISDRASEAPLSDTALRSQAAGAGQQLTYTAVPPGEGQRIGLDRDEDGFLNSDERDGGGNPADALSLPCMSSVSTGWKRAKLQDDKGKLILRGTVSIGAYAYETTQLIIDDGGGVIFDSGVLGSLFEINKSGNKFKYKAPRKQPGIVKVQLKENKKSPGTFKINVKTKDAWAAPAADETVATTFVTFNVGGQCFAGNATGIK